MKNEIKQELEAMHSFMDADATLCEQAGMDYGYEEMLQSNYKRIADKFNVTVEEVEAIDHSDLMRDLIAALNGDAYEEAQGIMCIIHNVGNAKLIEQAEYAASVL